MTDGTESVYTPSSHVSSNRTSNSSSSNASGLLRIAMSPAVAASPADTHHKIFEESVESSLESSHRTKTSGQTGRDSGKLVPLIDAATVPVMAEQRPNSSYDKTPLILQFLRENGVEVDSLSLVDTETMLDMIPKDVDGQLTSMGALLHSAGTCSPCLFRLKSRCNKSWRCTYCHLPHKVKRSKRIRPSKATRLQLRENALGFDDEAELDDVEEDEHPANPASSRDFLQHQLDTGKSIANQQEHRDTPNVLDRHGTNGRLRSNLVRL